MNPLVPSTADGIWALFALAWLGLTLAAVISLSRSGPALASGQRLSWLLFIVLAPILGAIAWLTVSRRAGDRLPD